MKLKDAFTPEFFALNQLIASRSLELYEAQFELGEPNLTAERRKELEDKINILSRSLGAWKMMKDLNQTHDANF